MYRVLVGKPEGKRPLGRPRRRWVNNNIVYHLQVNMFNALSQVHRIQLFLNVPSVEHEEGTYHEVELCAGTTGCTNTSRPLSKWKSILVAEVVHTSTRHYRRCVDKKPSRYHFCVTLYFSFTSCSTCFGQPCAHLQELTTV